MNETGEKETERERKREATKRSIIGGKWFSRELARGLVLRGYFRAALFLLALPATRARRCLLINLFRAKARRGGVMAISRAKDSEKRHRRPGYKNKKDWPTARDHHHHHLYILPREEFLAGPMPSSPPNLSVKRLDDRSSKLSLFFRARSELIDACLSWKIDERSAASQQFSPNCARADTRVLEKYSISQISPTIWNERASFPSKYAVKRDLHDSNRDFVNFQFNVIRLASREFFLGEVGRREGLIRLFVEFYCRGFALDDSGDVFSRVPSCRATHRWKLKWRCSRMNRWSARRRSRSIHASSISFACVSSGSLIVKFARRFLLTIRIDRW